MWKCLVRVCQGVIACILAGLAVGCRVDGAGSTSGRAVTGGSCIVNVGTVSSQSPTLHGETSSPGVGSALKGIGGQR